MTELEKLRKGKPYRMDDPEIVQIHHRAAALYPE